MASARTRIPLPTPTKSCPVCGSVFAKRFSDGAKSWGKRTYCSRRCGVLATRDVRHTNRRRPEPSQFQIVTNNSKRCSECREVLATDCFRYMGVNTASGFCSMCKACCYSKRVRSKECVRKRVLKHSSIDRFLCHLWQNAKGNAKRRKLEFVLAREWMRHAYDQQGGRCYYSGIPMTFMERCVGSNISLERINCKIGYVPDNVALCCWAINMSKGTQSIEEWLDWASKVKDHLAVKQQDGVK